MMGLPRICGLGMTVVGLLALRVDLAGGVCSDETRRCCSCSAEEVGGGVVLVVLAPSVGVECVCIKGFLMALFDLSQVRRQMMQTH